jgi:hypothetical protein
VRNHRRIWLDIVNEPLLPLGVTLHLDPSRAAADAVSTERSAADRRLAASARMDRQMAVLDRLVEIGLEIAEEAGRQARAPAADRPLVDPGLTYSRAARAVRLTIALQQRLAKDIAGLARDEACSRRNRIHRAVEEAIAAERDDGIEIETLSEEARERLWDDESFDDLADLTLDEAVALICKDLGLSPEASTEIMEAVGDEPDTSSATSLPIADDAAALFAVRGHNRLESPYSGLEAGRYHSRSERRLRPGAFRAPLTVTQRRNWMSAGSGSSELPTCSRTNATTRFRPDVWHSLGRRRRPGLKCRRS